MSVANCQALLQATHVCLPSTRPYLVQVWHADCSATGARVAIKMVNMDLDGSTLLDKATTEALILRSMAHPNILPMHTCFLAGPPSTPPKCTPQPPQQLEPAAADRAPVHDTAHAAESPPKPPLQPRGSRLITSASDTAHELPHEQPQLPPEQLSDELGAASLEDRLHSNGAASTTAPAPHASAAAGFDFDAPPGQQSKCWLWMVLPCMEASLLDVLHLSHPQVCHARVHASQPQVVRACPLAARPACQTPCSIAATLQLSVRSFCQCMLHPGPNNRPCPSSEYACRASR